MPYNTTKLLELGEEQAMQTVQMHKPSDDDSSKKERLEARITTGQKTLFTRAADIMGISVTAFVVSSAVEKAESTVYEHDSMTLNAPDSAAFVHALLNPPAPSKELRKAWRRYNQRFNRSDP